MKYMGSKSRIVPYIVPIIQDYIDKSTGGIYIEPFCGGCNVIRNVKASIRIASDKEKYLIAMFENLGRLKKLPEFVTKEHYSDVRNCYNIGSKKYEDWYIGAIGYLASYNGRFFDGGYAGLVKTKVGTTRDYYAEAKRNIEHQAIDMKDVLFFCEDYQDLLKNKKIPEIGAVIYCDPPYKGTKKYASRGFDHGKFWDWCREQSKKNIVLVSEREAPEDFNCIWEQQVTRTIDNTKRVKSEEKLFIYKK